MNCKELWRLFDNEGINFFTGVPDSTFKHWIDFLAANHNKGLTNITACNECEAVAIASGYHMGSSKFGVVYTQNSGLGKTINPITSLVDPEVYSIPLLLMIGWRGEPGIKDEPQHKKMGRIMLPLLDVLEIPYAELPDNLNGASKIIMKAKKYILEKNAPYAIIVKKGVLEKYTEKIITQTNSKLTREETINLIMDNIDKSDAIISTTGKTSRELFELRISKLESPRDFYTVGSMGCSASIALGLALQKPSKEFFILDGDGAVIMQMGTLATIGHYKPKNLHHIIIDNGSYESTGGQPTVSNSLNFAAIAMACGYKSSKEVTSKSQLLETIKEIKNLEGPNLLLVKVKKGTKKNLRRPTKSPIENKEEFMKFIG